MGNLGALATTELENCHMLAVVYVYTENSKSSDIV